MKKPIAVFAAACMLASSMALAACSSEGAQEPAQDATEAAAPAEEKAPEPDVPAEYKSALKKAQSYSDMMHMSKAGLYKQLTSEYGEQFTQEEADYAIANL